MTALEIINETVEYYSKDTKLRASKNGGCYYFQESTGNMCAVGRCANKPRELDGDCYFKDLKLLDEEIFKPEYRGHSKEFWTDLQRFHDLDANWDASGLSSYGEVNLETLKKAYS